MMARGLIATWTVLTVIGLLGGTAAATSPDPTWGVKHASHHKIVVTGVRSDLKRATSAQHVRTVDCNAAVRKELISLGDPDAAKDAGLCTIGGECGVNSSPTRLDGKLTMTGHPGLYVADRFTCWSVRLPISAQAVRDRATRLIPAAAIGLAPHGTTLVNIDTIMWVGAPREQTLPVIRMFGHDVVVRLAFAHVDWDFGDGLTTGSDGPGRAYDPVTAPCRTKECPGYFTHAYLHVGSRTVTATVSWTATFTVDGAGQQAIGGTVDGPVARAELAVREARGVLVPNPGDH